MLGTDVYAAYMEALLNGTAPRASEGNGTRPAQSAPAAASEDEASQESSPESAQESQESEPAA
jgi:hypothetical protein